MHIVSRVGIGKVPPSDPLYLDVGGAVNFDSTLRVIGKTTVNALISAQLATNTTVFESRIDGDTNFLFAINRDGKIEWGAGSASVPDVNLYRSAINTLTTNGSLIINNSLVVGDDISDTVTFTARVASNFDPSTSNLYSLGQDTLRWQNLWLSVKLTSVDGLFTGDLQVDNNTILGDSSADTLAVNARVSTSFIPSLDNDNDLGSLSLRWKSLWLGSNLQVDGNTILGDLSSDTLAVNARVSTSFIPSLDNDNDLGSLSLRWKSLWLGSNLQVDGNTILGDSSADTVTINAGVASPVNPSVDNFYDLGTYDYRWKTIHAGSSIVLHDDITNTNKLLLEFDSSIAQIKTNSLTNLQITTGVNQGILIDTTGKVGVNTTAALTHAFNVNGNSTFSDTANFSKATGNSLYVESVVAINGSIESGNSSKFLNVGVLPQTEFLNIGTGDDTKTINIGTGSGKTIINIGGALDIVNISGTVTNSQTIDALIKDKTFTLNSGGLNNTAQNSGLIVEESDSSLLQLTDPTWQSQNIVRYSAVDTGSIKLGSVITITSFSVPAHNGQFIVSGLSNNSYIEVNNPAVFDSSYNELGSGFSTNPLSVASIILNSSRSGWDIKNVLYPSNYFRISNTGADVELIGTSSGLSVNASALIPYTANTPLGSSSKPWNGFLNDLTANGNSIIGDSLTLTSTTNFYSLTAFNNKITSNFIPSGTRDLGSTVDQWENLYVKNITNSTSLIANGSVTLGQSSANTITVSGRFTSDLVPNASTYSIGSAALPWNQVYANTIIFPSFAPGSIIFTNYVSALSANNSKFFWNDTTEQLYIGQNTGSFVLDILKTNKNAIRIRNSDNSSSIALRTSETLYSAQQIVANPPLGSETTSVVFSSPVIQFAQLFSLASSTKLSKIGLQLSLITPPPLSTTMNVSLFSVSGGVPDTLIAETTGIDLSSLSGFQSSYLEFLFSQIVNISAGTYAILVSITNQSNPSIDGKVKILTTASNPYSGVVLKQFDSSTSSWSTVASQNAMFTIYELVDLNTPVSNKLEYTNKLQIGASTYANVGNGASTALLELSDTAISLLGAVSHTTASVSSATYTVGSTDTIIYVDTSVSGCTITLPSAATKRLLVIKDIGDNASASGRSIQLAPAVGQYVEFNAVDIPFVMDSDGASLTIHSNGSNRWYII